MPEIISATNQLVSNLTLGGQIIIAVTLLALAFRGKENGSIEFIQTHAMKIVLLISFGAIAVSLFYSNFIGFPPCTLCWWQRVFMYPIFFLSAMAVVKRDNSIADYLLLLTLLGTLVAVQHVYLERGGTSILPCDATTVSCSERFVYEYGYITIPVMSLTGFLMIGTVLGIKKYS